MRIWIDAQMSPAIATWISSNYAVSAVAIRDLGLRDPKDKEIFEAARQEEAMVMTKDSDFVLLLDKALDLLNLGEKLVEINAA
jgi:predicted nuclease of predicted toxin-antitoxin system